jgi:hypothetical protein
MIVVEFFLHANPVAGVQLQTLRSSRGTSSPQKDGNISQRCRIRGCFIGHNCLRNIIADCCIHSKIPSSEGVKRFCPRPTSGYITIQHSVRLDNGPTNATMRVLFAVTAIVLPKFAVPVNFNDVLLLVKRQPPAGAWNLGMSDQDWDDAINAWGSFVCPSSA